MSHRAMIPLALAVAAVLPFLAGCTRVAERESPWRLPALQTPFAATGSPGPALPTSAAPAEGFLGHTPTPDPPRPLPALRQDPEYYVVQYGDTLMQIASRYRVTVKQIVAANHLPNPDLLEVGQVLEIPAPEPGEPGPALKLIPDSELVYGPNAAEFDIAAFILHQNGYLTSYSEVVNAERMTGAQIVERIAQNYSVNPRLLLAALEHQSQWLSDPAPPKDTLEYPLRLYDPWRKGLYLQLAWAADHLNRGFYLWQVNGLGGYILPDGSLIPADPTINAGTAAVQFLFSQLYGEQAWRETLAAQGFGQTFNRLFGNPFAYTYEPLLPPGLTQPDLLLPFPKGEVWRFTGGPHGGWDSGSAWAALDFAPPGDAAGCVQSEAWVTAVADGWIVRTGDGAVIQDLDQDGLEQTGWVILYMHIESRDRVQPGKHVRAGDRIGHPSCEGGISSGTHLHLARKYNGQWIPADQPDLPFVLEGWVSSGTGVEYDGFLTRDGVRVEAYAGDDQDINEIQR